MQLHCLKDVWTNTCIENAEGHRPKQMGLTNNGITLGKDEVGPHYTGLFLYCTILWCVKRH